jgi:hypothetical protein
MADLSKDFFTALPFWADLDRHEQSVVRNETVALEKAVRAHVASRVAMARSLVALQAALKGNFVKYLETLDFSYRTSYRLIGSYKRLEKELPAAVIDGAIDRGMDIIGSTPGRPYGEYTEPFKSLPAPTKASEVDGFLDEAQKLVKTLPSPQKRARRGRTVATEIALRDAYRGAVKWYKVLGVTGKARANWATQLLSYLMMEFGLPAQKLEPAAVPEGFRAVVGRPPLKK